VTIRHGTTAGWHAHQRAGKRPCAPCFWAKHAYDQRRLQNPGPVRAVRISARARQEAVQGLCRAHQEEYRALYLAARQRLTEEDQAEENRATG
jgi:hypothetical protein